MPPVVPTFAPTPKTKCLRRRSRFAAHFGIAGGSDVTDAFTRWNYCFGGVTFLTCRCGPNKHYRLLVEVVMADINRTANSTAKRDTPRAPAALWRQLFASFGPFVPLLIAVV